MPPVSKALAKLDASKLDEMSFVKVYMLMQAVTNWHTQLAAVDGHVRRNDEKTTMALPSHPSKLPPRGP